ncbi:hypothetical protein QBC43DRAFT_287922 [Cladorrhinum sp. PSN259]|nr:hypothetical protein QBC43DRAFT_287922 [Cladorrhinum sp. PSN259]
MSHRASLLQAATSFCESFASQKPPNEIFSHFTAAESNIFIFEHGLPRLAPFLGREFRGKDGLQEYFKIISECLTYKNMRFSNYVVDTEARRVSVRGEATFTWSSTGQSWDEVFTYVLKFDDNDKVEKYEVWADSGAAYLASQGLLT